MAGDEKAQGKVEIKIGNLSFSAEGDQQWLAEQLSKVLEAASSVIAQVNIDDGQGKAMAAPCDRQGHLMVLSRLT